MRVLRIVFQTQPIDMSEIWECLKMPVFDIRRRVTEPLKYKNRTSSQVCILRGFIPVLDRRREINDDKSKRVFSFTAKRSSLPFIFSQNNVLLAHGRIMKSVWPIFKKKKWKKHHNEINMHKKRRGKKRKEKTTDDDDGVIIIVKKMWKKKRHAFCRWCWVTETYSESLSCNLMVEKQR